MISTNFASGQSRKNVLQRLRQQGVQLIADDVDNDVLLERFTFDRAMLPRRIVAVVEFRERETRQRRRIENALARVRL